MSIEDAQKFYAERYVELEKWVLRPQDTVTLGATASSCRFCGASAPEVSFRKVAHAVPECLGNKTLRTLYECDVCNAFFGRTIEDDLGKWSKPSRTFGRIRGKSGVPILKKGGPDPGWRIEYDGQSFNITAYEDDPLFVIDDEADTVTFRLKRDAYTPIAVLKAFMKIGLTLMPEAEVGNFTHLRAWVMEPDHSKKFADSCPVFYTFIPGPMPNDVLTVYLMRRRPRITGVPYAFLIIAYGNEVFQVMLPSKQHDEGLAGYTAPPFPLSSVVDPGVYGLPRYGMRDLSGREVVKGEMLDYTLSFNKVKKS